MRRGARTSAAVLAALALALAPRARAQQQQQQQARALSPSGGGGADCCGGAGAFLGADARARQLLGGQFALAAGHPGVEGACCAVESGVPLGAQAVRRAEAHPNHGGKTCTGAPPRSPLCRAAQGHWSRARTVLLCTQSKSVREPMTDRAQAAWAPEPKSAACARLFELRARAAPRPPLLRLATGNRACKLSCSHSSHPPFRRYTRTQVRPLGWGLSELLVTGVALALVRHGGWTLGTRVADVLPWWTAADTDASGLGDVRVHHLLGHTSGASGAWRCGALDSAACARQAYRGAWALPLETGWGDGAGTTFTGRPGVPPPPSGMPGATFAHAEANMYVLQEAALAAGNALLAGQSELFSNSTNSTLSVADFHELFRTLVAEPLGLSSMCGFFGMDGWMAHCTAADTGAVLAAWASDSAALGGGLLRAQAEAPRTTLLGTNQALIPWPSPWAFGLGAWRECRSASCPAHEGQKVSWHDARTGSYAWVWRRDFETHWGLLLRTPGGSSAAGGAVPAGVPAAIGATVEVASDDEVLGNIRRKVSYDALLASGTLPPGAGSGGAPTMRPGDKVGLALPPPPPGAISARWRGVESSAPSVMLRAARSAPGACVAALIAAVLLLAQT